ncbi:MAG: hypothetical protein AB7L13_13110 [Acidimicrobiia bacterium]
MMLITYWNALRVGDAVHVHTDGESATRSARVVIVDASSPRHEIGVRLDDEPTSAVIWPGRLRVHFAARDVDDQCRWCTTAESVAV